MKPRSAIVPLILLVLANCGSSPKTHFFTLAVVPGTARDKGSIAYPVTVAAVHVPPSLDRRAMVRRTGETTVEVSDQDRWAAPLDEMVRNVLSQDLLDRLPKDKVVLPESPAPPKTAQIVVSISQFGPDATGGIILHGSWSLVDDAQGEPLLRRNVTLESNSPAENGASEAAAMSQLLGQLASQIASTLPGSL